MMSDDDSCIVFVGTWSMLPMLDIYLQLRERACEKKTADRRPAPWRMAWHGASLMIRGGGVWSVKLAS